MPTNTPTVQINEIAFFAYAVSDIKKARAFYEDILNLKPNGEYGGSGNPNWVEYDIGAGTLGIGCAPGMFDPSPKGASAAVSHLRQSRRLVNCEPLKAD